MSHELEIMNGRASMAYFGDAPWHGLGQEATDDMLYDYPKFMETANLNRKVITEELFTKAGVSSDMYATMYEGAKEVLGVVSSKYQPLQNVDSFKFFEEWLKVKAAALHTAGALYGGKRVWVLAQVAGGNIEVAKGDEIARFILLSNSHDGKTSVRVGFTPIRVVCANTLAWAVNDDASQLIRIRHSKQVKENLNNIQAIMDIANNQFLATTDQYKVLCQKQINKADLEKYIKVVFGFDKKEAEDGELSTRAKNIIKDIIKTVDSGVGQDVVSTRGTLYWAYNGVNNYLNYSDGRNSESIMDKLWFGTNAGINQKALNMALAMAA